MERTETLVSEAVPEVSAPFLKKLEAAFSEKAAIWKPGDDLPECARKAGNREVIEWIKHHARVA